MRNILSYEAGTQFTGQEILDWAKAQVENKTSHQKQGEIILRRFYNLNPTKLYLVQTNYRGTASGEIIHKPLVINLDKNRCWCGAAGSASD